MKSRPWLLWEGPPPRRSASSTRKELANTAWAFATAQHPEPVLFQAIGSQVVLKAPQFKAQEISNTLWAFAKLDVPNADEVFASLADAAIRLAYNNPSRPTTPRTCPTPSGPSRKQEGATRSCTRRWGLSARASRGTSRCRRWRMYVTVSLKQASSCGRVDGVGADATSLRPRSRLETSYSARRPWDRPRRHRRDGSPSSAPRIAEVAQHRSPGPTRRTTSSALNYSTR